MVLLFTDIADSVAMKRRLGDAAYLNLLTRHNELFQAALDDAPGARIIKHTGDGFLARFETPADGVRAALAFQYALHHEPWPGQAVLSRAALHTGTAIELTDRAGQTDISGFAVDVTARVMSLAAPGQVLLTRQCFDDARQYVREHPTCGARRECPTLEWRAHGPYLFKGNDDDPLEVFEVGALGIAPLTPPADSEKARRAVAAGEEEMYGWRPGKGLEVPRRDGWILERQLGVGGYGEVWLAEHRKTREHRVFKFCFDADRLRSFKRELTLFRLMREALGDRRDIARLHEVNLERPPFYLESEYSPLGDLYTWAESQGGIAGVPLETRLDLLARTADAVAAAHSIGVLHKDLKPSNILIELVEDGSPRPKITDFGIGVLTDHSQLAGRNITIAGFTVSQLTQNESSRTGTRMYSPPEMLTRLRHEDGRERPTPFTAQGDVYSLGVMLYQMIVGDLDRPLAPGWERDLEGVTEDQVLRSILREDVSQMVDGDPARRLAGAAEVAARIRRLDERRAERWHEAQRRAAQEDAERRAVEAESRRRTTRRVAMTSTLVLGALLAVTGAFLWRERGLRDSERDARQEAQRREREANAALGRAEIAEADSRRRAAELEKVAEFQASQLSGIETELMGIRLRRSILEERRSAMERAERDAEEIEHALQDLDLAMSGVNFTSVALKSLETNIFNRALKAIEGQFADQPLVRARLLQTVADALRDLGLLDRGTPAQNEALDIRRRMLGDEHPDTLVSINHAGRLLNARGKLAEAEAHHREALEAGRRALGDEHPVTLYAMMDLGVVVEAQGRHAEAASIYNEALNLSRNVWGAEHPDTLVLLNNFSLMLTRQSRFEEAERLIREGLAIRRRMFGDDHRDTLVSLGSLGFVLDQLGQFAEAERCFAEALEGSRRILGDDHPDTLMAINNMGYRLNAQQRFAEAEPFFREALEGSRRSLGSEHPLTLVQINNMGFFLENQRRYSEAEPYFREALEGSRRALGDDHYRTITFMNNLAMALKGQGDLVDAERYYREAIETGRRSLGVENLDVLTSIANLSALLRDLGQFVEAEQLGDEVVTTARRVLPQGHWLTGVFLGHHARTLAAMSRFGQAEERAIESHTIIEQALGPAHPRTRGLIVQLGELYDGWHAAEPDKGYDAKAAQWREKLRALEPPVDDN